MAERGHGDRRCGLQRTRVFWDSATAPPHVVPPMSHVSICHTQIPMLLMPHTPTRACGDSRLTRTARTPQTTRSKESTTCATRNASRASHIHSRHWPAHMHGSIPRHNRRAHVTLSSCVLPPTAASTQARTHHRHRHIRHHTMGAASRASLHVPRVAPSRAQRANAWAISAPVPRRPSRQQLDDVRRSASARRVDTPASTPRVVVVPPHALEGVSTDASGT